MKLSTQRDKLVLASEVEWWSRFIGLPFLLLGILSAVSWLNGGMTDESGQQASLGMALVFIGPFGLLGLALSFGRIKLILDRRNRTATRWIGALLPIWKRSLDWSGLTRVSLETVHRSNDGHSYKNYAVMLSGPDGQISCSNMFCPHECRRLARKVAIFTELPLHDTLNETTVPYQELKGNLRERLRRQGQETSSNDPPPEGISADRVGGSLKIKLEPTGMTFGRQFMYYVQLGGFAILMLPLAYTVLAALFAESAEPGLRVLALPWFLVLVVVIMAARRLHWKTKREAESEEEIELSGTELMWKQSWRSESRKRTLPIDEIEELELDYRGIIVLTASDSLRLIDGAHQHQQNWIFAALKSHLASV